MLVWEHILRLLLAGVLGALVGLDREYRSKEAGFRTHFLVALGSALFMLVSKYGFNDVLQDGVRLDPSRIAAQVVSGIGFLGAGTIIIHKQFVRGLTTAAGVWATSAIGIVVGAGMYWIGIISTILTLVALEGLGYFFRRLTPRSVLLVFSTSLRDNITLVMNEVKRLELYTVNYNTEIGTLGEQPIYRVTLILKVQNFGDENFLLDYLYNLSDVFVERMES